MTTNQKMNAKTQSQEFPPQFFKDNCRNIRSEILREAAYLGDINIAKDMLKKDVEINVKSPLSGNTALHLACINNCQEMVELLLNNRPIGADPLMKNDEEKLPKDLTTSAGILALLNPGTNPVDRPVDRPAPIDTETNPNPQDIPDSIVLKIRNVGEDDYHEIELLRSQRTFAQFEDIVRLEMDVQTHQVVKLRKIPQLRLTRDFQIIRLKDDDEIEVIVT